MPISLKAKYKSILAHLSFNYEEAMISLPRSTYQRIWANKVKELFLWHLGTGFASLSATQKKKKKGFASNWAN